MIPTVIAPDPHTGVLSSLTERVPTYSPSRCVHANSSRCHPTLATRRNEKSIKRVLFTPAVYPRLFELLHFDIQSTGQKSRCVNTGRQPAHCSVLIKQSDSPCPFSVLDRYLLHDAPPIFPRARLPLSPSARRSRATRPSPRRDFVRSALAILPSASGRTSRKSGSISAYLENQSFFRSYGSILPTSLVCIVRYRPETTRLGDLLRSIGTRSHEIQLHLPGFSRDGSEAPDDAQHGRRFSAAPPTASPLDAIPRSTYFWRPYQEKRALPGLLSHRLRGCLRRRQAPDRANGPKANLRVEALESMPDSLLVGQGPNFKSNRLNQNLISLT